MKPLPPSGGNEEGCLAASTRSYVGIDASFQQKLHLRHVRASNGILLDPEVKVVLLWKLMSLLIACLWSFAANPAQLVLFWFGNTPRDLKPSRK